MLSIVQVPSPLPVMARIKQAHRLTRPLRLSSPSTSSSSFYVCRSATSLAYSPAGELLPPPPSPGSERKQGRGLRRAAERNAARLAASKETINRLRAANLSLKEEVICYREDMGRLVAQSEEAKTSGCKPCHAHLRKAADPSVPQTTGSTECRRVHERVLWTADEESMEDVCSSPDPAAADPAPAGPAPAGGSRVQAWVALSIS